ncbi:MAG TPA: putative peptidoglycan glycosyltransferase FtsW [Gemmatimonadales bacterium]|nr:putative peptidoglycan glycosyltransferase FtsW [Gemmatimonadales bacterium]
MSAPAIRHPGEYRWETRLLAVITAVLVVFGIASTYGAASLQTNRAGDLVGFGFALRQATGAVIGGIALLIVSRLDYHLWRKFAWPLLLVTILFLLIPVLPGTESIAKRVNGARRWVDIGPLNFQPSELAKLTLVIWCSMLAAKKGAQIREFKKGLLPFLIVIGLVAGLVFLEPNLSMAIMVAFGAGVVIFTAGARISAFLLLAMVALPLVYTKIVDTQYRAARLATFLNEGQASDAASFQITQSKIGFGSGQLFGVGYGQGQQKLGYLPYNYSDFLFSSIGEEWGFVGVAVLILLFAMFVWLGYRIARTAPDPFGQYLAVGITTGIGVTAFLHMAVTMGMMPTTGLTLPFMSYGRSSLMIALLSTGILLSIGRGRGKVPKPEKASAGRGGRR